MALASEDDVFDNIMEWCPEGVPTEVFRSWLLGDIDGRREFGGLDTEDVDKVQFEVPVENQSLITALKSEINSIWYSAKKSIS